MLYSHWDLAIRPCRPPRANISFFSRMACFFAYGTVSAQMGDSKCVMDALNWTLSPMPSLVHHRPPWWNPRQTRYFWLWTSPLLVSQLTLFLHQPMPPPFLLGTTSTMNSLPPLSSHPPPPLLPQLIHLKPLLLIPPLSLQLLVIMVTWPTSVSSKVVLLPSCMYESPT